MKVLLHLIVLALLQITFSCCYSNTELKGGETATHRHIKYYSGLYSFDLIRVFDRINLSLAEFY